MAAPVAAITVFAAADGAPKAGKQTEKEMAKQLRAGGWDTCGKRPEEPHYPPPSQPAAQKFKIRVFCPLYSLDRSLA